jgi:hypothetical protein
MARERPPAHGDPCGDLPQRGRASALGTPARWWIMAGGAPREHSRPPWRGHAAASRRLLPAAAPHREHQATKPKCRRRPKCSCSKLTPLPTTTTSRERCRRWATLCRPRRQANTGPQARAVLHRTAASLYSSW